MCTVPKPRLLGRCPGRGTCRPAGNGDSPTPDLRNLQGRAVWVEQPAGAAIAVSGRSALPKPGLACPAHSHAPGPLPLSPCGPGGALREVAQPRHNRGGPAVSAGLPAMLLGGRASHAGSSWAGREPRGVGVGAGRLCAACKARRGSGQRKASPQQAPQRRPIKPRIKKFKKNRKTEITKEQKSRDNISKIKVLINMLKTKQNKKTGLECGLLGSLPGGAHFAGFLRLGESATRDQGGRPRGQEKS